MVHHSLHLCVQLNDIFCIVWELYIKTYFLYSPKPSVSPKLCKNSNTMRMFPNASGGSLRPSILAISGSGTWSVRSKSSFTSFIS